MSLAVNIVERAPGYYLVNLEGRLDSETYALCEEKLSPLFKNEVEGLMFDMAKLNYISSMGLRVIFKLRKTLESTGGSLLMVNLQPQIEKVVEIANALPKTNLFSSMAEADRYFDVMQRRELDKQKQKE